MFARLIGRFALLAFVAGFLLAWVSSGQGQGKEKELIVHDDIKKEMDGNYQKRIELINGTRPPQGAEDQKIMKTTAKWYVQRVTMYAILNAKPSEMARYHESLENELIKPLLLTNAVKGNKVFVEQLGKHLADSLREVFKLDFTDNRNAIVNAALMLPPIAKLKQEEIAKLLVELLKDKNQHDAVKLYAVKALAEFSPLHIATVNSSKKEMEQLDREKDRLNAILDFMKRTDPLPKDEGEREAIRYLRREAVTTLATMGVPALSALKKDGEVKGPVAYELLKVLVKGKDAYDPPPLLSERVEAALGLCQLKDPLGDLDYDPSLAVCAVGLCFYDFAKEYSEDYVNFVGRKDFKNPAKESKISNLPWRIQSERFKQALSDLVANTKGTPAQANAAKLYSEASKMTDTMRFYNRLEDNLGLFRKMAEGFAPKTGKLYKLKGPDIDPASLLGGAPAGNGI